MPKSMCFTSHLPLSRGARYYRCAFQVNPASYMAKYRGAAHGLSEDDYIDQVLVKCIEQGVQVLAITDHNHIGSIARFREKANEKAVVVLPGFELGSSEGVHVLCIYPPDSTTDALGRFLGDLGVIDTSQQSKLCTKSFADILESVKGHGGITIAAHVTQTSGLLHHITGQARINAWKDPNLLASQIPGSVKDVPPDKLPICRNTNPDYKREHVTSDGYAMAFVNAKDVAEPVDITDPGSTTYVKMCQVSVDGLKQAFLDPGSRIRLNSDVVPDNHVEFVAISWASGFLGDATIHFNENLNVLIGGRGSGKSTVIESIRYVLGLEPVGADAKTSFDGIIKSVLGSGTKISLLVRTHNPSMREFLIERTVPLKAVVKDESGNVLGITPQDIVPRAEVYGQHEISEIAKSPERCTKILERFIDNDPELPDRKKNALRELEESRTTHMSLQKELREKDERLSKLPMFEEKLKGFKAAGLDVKLRDRSLVIREQGILNDVDKMIEPFRVAVSALSDKLPIDSLIVSDERTSELPGRELLQQAAAVLSDFGEGIQNGVNLLSAVISDAELRLATIRQAWKARFDKVEAEYAKLLKDLKTQGIDGADFIYVQEEIEKLRPVGERKLAILEELDRLVETRKQQLAAWNTINKNEFTRLDKAARKVTRKLTDRVRVHVSFEGNRQPLEALLREKFSGRIVETIELLLARPSLSVSELVEACRTGKDRLVEHYELPVAQAEKLTTAPADVLMLMEELDLPAVTSIELNTAIESTTPEWKLLKDLSTGQKATAILLLLLLQCDAPLVVDQPEDDLDNRFITEGIVPKMREEKQQRQFIFATHNANIPVLGDAELIVGLASTGSASGRVRISEEHMGSIDDPKVKLLVEEVLEGGKMAFELRRRKYRF